MLRHEQHSGERSFEGKPRAVSLGVDQYLWVLRRRWRLIAVITLLVPLLAGAYLFIAPRTSTATTSLNLNVITTGPFSTQRSASGLLDSAAEADIARSHIVAERASVLLGGDLTPQEIRKASEVSTTPETTVVKVVFTAPSDEEAIAGADAVATAYLDFRHDQAEERAATIIDSLTKQIDALNESLNESNTVIASTPPSSAKHVQALTQQQQLLTELDDILSARNALRSIDTTAGTVLSGAENNAISRTPERGKTLLTAGAAGLILGIIAAFATNPFSRRVRGAKEASRILEAPVLTRAPNQRDAADKLEVSRERLLTDFEQGRALLVFATNPEGPSSAVSTQIISWFDGLPREIRVLAPDIADAAAVVAALREADAAVVVLDPAPARSDVLEWFKEEATASGTPILGIIEL